MVGVFKSNAEFWGWDGDYVSSQFTSCIVEARGNVSRYLAPENPLMQHVSTAADAMSDVVSEVMQPANSTIQHPDRL